MLNFSDGTRTGCIQKQQLLYLTIHKLFCDVKVNLLNELRVAKAGVDGLHNIDKVTLV
jgi:hypothetical protein